MDNRLEGDTIVEDVLKSLSLVEMPKNITQEVLSRIKKDSRPSIITWNDLGLSLIISTCIASSWFAILNLPPLLLAKLRIQGILLYQDILLNAGWFVPTLLFSLAGVMVIISLYYFQRRFKH